MLQMLMKRAQLAGNPLEVMQAKKIVNTQNRNNQEFTNEKERLDSYEKELSSVSEQIMQKKEYFDT